MYKVQPWRTHADCITMLTHVCRHISLRGQSKNQHHLIHQSHNISTHSHLTEVHDQNHIWRYVPLLVHRSVGMGRRPGGLRREHYIGSHSGREGGGESLVKQCWCTTHAECDINRARITWQTYTQWRHSTCLADVHAELIISCFKYSCIWKLWLTLLTEHSQCQYQW